MNERRRCLYDGKHAWFHRWSDWSEIVGPSMMVGGHNGGELRYCVAIIELEDGTVKCVMPEKIRFTDHQEPDWR